MTEGCRCQILECFPLVIVFFVMKMNGWLVGWFVGMWCQMPAENMMDLLSHMKFQKR